MFSKMNVIGSFATAIIHNTRRASGLASPMS
jgi:hypothetical protein